MSRPLPDDAARARVRKQLGTALACEAGAGTGKTTLLVDRILRGLQAGAFACPELVAITFTRKAARELRERVRRGIAAALARESGEEVRRRLLAARRELPLARLTTIHAFCRRILAQFALEARLDPSFQVVDEGEERLHARDLWREWLAERLAGEGGLPALEELIAGGVSLERIEELARFAAENPDLTPPPPPPAEDAGEGALFDTVVAKVGEWRARARGALRPGEADRFADDLDRLCAVLDRIAGLPPGARARWLLDRCDRGELKLPGVRLNTGRKPAYRDPEELTRLREEIKAFREESGRRAGVLFAPLVARAAQEIDRFRDWARARRRDRGLLSHVDLLYETRELLRREPRVARRLRAEIRALLVDEHQDTDPLQAEIIETLASGPEAPVLFVVGDPKQSIYRFRRADVLCYQRQAREFDGQGALVRIGTNFRSRAALLEAINRIGREIFAREQWQVDEGDGRTEQAEWQDLVPPPERSDAAEDEGPALVLLPIEPEEGERADARAEREARALAAEIAAAREQGYPLREMAILFPTAGRARLLEDVLDEAGLPYRQERSQHFYRRLEVAELVQVLESVADPWDATRAVAALRSRLLAVTDAALARHARAGGRLIPAEPGKQGDGDVREALARIRRWSEQARETAPPRLIEAILDETRYPLLLETLSDGRRAAGNLAKLLDVARVQWRETGRDLAALAGELRARIDEEQAREPEAPEAEDDDRVTLLTIHGAKGLEWDWVGLFDVCAGGSTRTPVALPAERGSGDPSARYEIDLGDGFRTFGWSQEKERNARLDLAERARLLYVALTRARRRIAIPCHPALADLRGERSLLALLRRSATFRDWEEAAGQGADPPEPWLAFRKGSAPEAAAPSRRRFGDPEEGRRHREAWVAARRALLDRADRRVVCVPSALHGAASPPDRPPAEQPGDERGDGLANGGAAPAAPDRAPNGEPGEPQGAGLAIGRAVHAALRWLVTGAARDPAEAARRAALAEDLGEVELATVGRCVANAAASPLFARALDAPGRWAELPLFWFASDRELPPRAAAALRARLRAAGRPEPEPPILVEGIADLVVRDGEEWLVLDYKTDAWSDEREIDALVARYAPQLELYAAALRAVTGAPVSAQLLFVAGERAVARAVV